jgi:hypothetical protein
MDNGSSIDWKIECQAIKLMNQIHQAVEFFAREGMKS